MPDATGQSPRQSSAPVPMRGTLPLDVEAAAVTIHRGVWGEPYRPLQGPMHFAGGSYWRNELLRLAAVHERQAKALRVCADFLPGEDEDGVR